MTKFIRQILLLLGTYAVSGILSVPVLAVESEWCFNQSHIQMGQQIIYISTDAIKIVSKTGGFVLLTKGPKWDVAIYRDDDRQIYIVPIDSFKRASLGFAYSDYNPAGAQPFYSDGIEHEKDLVLEKKTGKDKRQTLWLVTNVHLAPQAAKALRTFFGFPILGLPYRYVNDYGDRKQGAVKNWLGGGLTNPFEGKNTVVTTTSYRKYNYIKSDFDYPTGYKQVSTAGNLTLSSKQKGQFNNLLEDMDIGTQFKK
jgi:hypothetical protein